MKKLFILIALTIYMVSFTITSQLVYAQSSSPEILWEKSYGGSETENVFSVQQTNDDGFVFAGQTGSDVWLVKTDAAGDTLWTSAIAAAEGGPFAASVRQTTDGGYIILGNSTYIGSSGGDIWLIKTDASGDTVWTKIFGRIAETEDSGNTVEQTSDGGYIVYGNTAVAGGRGAWLIKTDAAGDTAWTKTFSEGVGSSDHELALTSDGGYIFTGQTGSDDLFIVKTDGEGSTVWSKIYDGSGADFGKGISLSDDGGYIITGFTGINGGSANLWLLKTDAMGDTIWTKVYGGSRYDEGRSVQQTSDGGYFLIGMTMSTGAGRMDAWLLKTDASGDTSWTMTWGGGENDQCYSGRQTKDGGYIVSAYTKSFSPGDINALLIRLAADATNIGNIDFSPETFQLYANYPNPFNPTTTITYNLETTSNVELNIYDVIGREIKTLVNQQQIAGEHSVIFDASNLTSGVYIYRLKIGAFEQSRKMLLMK